MGIRREVKESEREDREVSIRESAIEDAQASLEAESQEEDELLREFIQLSETEIRKWMQRNKRK